MYNGKLGFSWETLQEINPRLIYASSSGFGHTGPLKDAPAYDTIIQAMSGIMMETGYPDAPPVRVGTSLADLCGGVYLFSGIVSALYGREKSQRGAHVDIAMFDATLSFLEHGLMAYIATGKSPQRLGNRHPYMAPFDVFNTQDKPITICCGNDKLFLRYAGHWSLRNWLMIPDLAAIFYAYKTGLFLNNILSGR